MRLDEESRSSFKEVGDQAGMAEVLREAIGTPIPPVYRLDYEQAVAKVRARVGDEAFVRVWNEGRSMMPEQAILG